MVEHSVFATVKTFHHTERYCATNQQNYGTSKNL